MISELLFSFEEFVDTMRFTRVSRRDYEFGCGFTMSKLKIIEDSRENLLSKTDENTPRPRKPHTEILERYIYILATGPPLPAAVDEIWLLPRVRSHIFHFPYRKQQFGCSIIVFFMFLLRSLS